MKALLIAAAIAATPTPAQIFACRADAQRLCAGAGDLSAVEACVLAHKAELSKACRATLPK